MNRSSKNLSNLSRRGFLNAGAASLAGLAAARFGLARQGTQNLYAPFKMGIQSYSLRGYDFEVALNRTLELGLGYWEAFPGHVALTDDPSARLKTLRSLSQRGVRLEAWGVQGFDKNAAFATKVFEFCKTMRIGVISADPSPEAFPILEDLVNEFDIRVAIHNHGPGSRYDKLGSVLKAIEGLDPRIGACVDTGHALRSGEDPVNWVRALGPKVHGVHLKDVKDKTRFTILGQGDLRVADFLKELLRFGYSQPISLEYEENPQNPMADLRACLSFAQSTIASVR